MGHVLYSPLIEDKRKAHHMVLVDLDGPLARPILLQKDHSISHGAHGRSPLIRCVWGSLHQCFRNRDILNLPHHFSSFAPSRDYLSLPLERNTHSGTHKQTNRRGRDEGYTVVGDDGHPGGCEDQGECQGIEVTGSRGTFARNFKHLNLDFQLITDEETGQKKLKVKSWFSSRKPIAAIRTALSHVNNL